MRESLNHQVHLASVKYGDQCLSAPCFLFTYLSCPLSPPVLSLCCLSSVASSVPPLHCAQCPHRHRSSSIERNVRYTCHRFLSESSHSSSSHIRFAVVRQLHSAASPASFSLASAICSDCASSVSLSANCYHRSEEQTGELALGFAFFLSSFISRQPSKEWRQAVQN